jgi:hypothetical protein
MFADYTDWKTGKPPADQALAGAAAAFSGCGDSRGKW